MSSSCLRRSSGSSLRRSVTHSTLRSLLDMCSVAAERFVGVVERKPVPEVVGVIDPMPDPDYTDAYEIDISGAAPRSSEQWARSVFEGAPRPMRWFLLAGSRVVLGLHLGPRHSADDVLGWHVLGRAPNSVTLELYSWFLSCHVVFWADDTRLVFSSSIRYERKDRHGHLATGFDHPPARGSLRPPARGHGHRLVSSPSARNAVPTRRRRSRPGSFGQPTGPWRRAVRS